MKEYYLNYYKNFECLKGKCPDTCCKSWGVDIDKVTHDKYQELSTPYGRQIQKTLKHKKQLFDTGSTCPFLTKDGLCDIVLHLGNDYLCETCKKYPRVVNQYGLDREHHLTLSCIEATNLLIKCPNLSIVKEDTNEKINAYNKFNSKLYPHLRKTRELLFDIIQKNQPILDTLSQLEKIGQDIQYLLFVYDGLNKLNINQYPTTNTALSKKSWLSLIQFYRHLECLNLEWRENLKQIYTAIKGDKLDLSKIKLTPVFSKSLSNVLYYYIFKYYLEGAYDFQPLSKIRLAISAILVEMSLMLYREVCKETNYKEFFAVDISQFSKEIEHSAKNMAKIDNYFKKHSIF